MSAGGGQTVTLQVAMRHEPVIRGLQNIIEQAEAVGRAGGRMGDDSEKGASKANSAWDRGLKTLMSYPQAMLGMVTGGAAVYEIVNRIRAEFERLDQIREKAMSKLDAVQEPFKNAQMQLDPKYMGSPEAKKGIIQGITNYGQADAGAGFMKMLQGMASAKGALMTSAQVMEAAQIGARFRGQIGLNDEDAAAVGGGLLDLMNTDLDAGRKPMSHKATMGMVSRMFALDRPTQMGGLFKYEMRAINTLEREHGWDRADAMALQATMAQGKPDLSGRTSSTSTQLFGADLPAAFNVLYNRGLTKKDYPDVTPENFKNLGARAFEMLIADNETQVELDALMNGINSKNPKARMKSNRYGIDYQGMMSGEAGMKEFKQNFFQADSAAWKRYRAAAKELRSGGDAANEAHYEELVGGKHETSQEQFFAARAKQRGHLGAMQYTNTTAARRGSLSELVKEIGDVYGSSAIIQTLKDSATTITASGKSQNEISDMEDAAMTDARNRVLRWGMSQPFTSEDSARFAKWRTKYHPQDKYKDGGLFREHFEEYRKLTMPEDDKHFVEIVDSFLEMSKDENKRSSELPATKPRPKVPEHNFSAPNKWTRPIQRMQKAEPGAEEDVGPPPPGWVPPAAPAPPTVRPGEKDQSARDRQLDQLIAVLSGGLQVMFVDEGGRRIGQTTSRPVGIDYHDDPRGLN